MFITNNNIGYI